MNFQNVVCPISTEKVDSNLSRITVFLNVVLLGVFLFTQNIIPVAIVALDYVIRAIGKNSLSPIRAIAKIFVKGFRVTHKPVNAAPKVFASRLGAICAVAATILFALNLSIAAYAIAGLLMTLAFLDSAFNFCMGCLIYNYLVLPFYKK